MELFFLCRGSVVVLFVSDDPTLTALNHGGLSMHTTKVREHVRHRRTFVVLSLVQHFGIRVCACISVQ